MTEPIDTNAARVMHRVVWPDPNCAQMQDTIDELCDEVDRLRAKIKKADEEVWRLVRDEYLWVSDTRNLRRILADE